MNKYIVMYKRERTTIKAENPWIAKQKAAVFFGLTRAQINGLGLELIDKDKT